jgi:hypothetical protein
MRWCTPPSAGSMTGMSKISPPGGVNLWGAPPPPAAMAGGKSPVCLSCSYERLSFVILLSHNTGKICSLRRMKKRIRMNPVRRVRMCYWKQWRRFRTRVRNLLKLGTHPGVPISMGFIQKGLYKCARTLALQSLYILFNRIFGACLHA